MIALAPSGRSIFHTTTSRRYFMHRTLDYLKNNDMVKVSIMAEFVVEFPAHVLDRYFDVRL